MSDNQNIKFVVSDEELENLIFKYNRDITRLEKDGKFDPVVGRDQEMENLLLILIQRGRKNALLLGGAGVGKTALFIKLAQRINSGNVPDYLKNARVIEIDMAGMSAGTRMKSEFEGRLIPLIKGVAERNASRLYPPIILMIDEFHTIMRGSDITSASGVSDIMKPYLTTGDLNVVGATTKDEHREFVEKDAAVDRRFQKIILEAPDDAETVRILRELKDLYVKHFKIEVPDELIPEIVRLASRFLPRRNNPDKALITLDVACAKAIMDKGTGTTLEKKHVVHAISTETGLHPAAIEGA